MFRRRRPLLGAAMIGGTAYMAGKSAERSADREADQEARLQQLEQQQYQQQPQPMPAQDAAPAGGGSDMISQLQQLGALQQQGVLTPEEFQAAKAKLLASS